MGITIIKIIKQQHHELNSKLFRKYAALKMQKK